MGLFSVGGPQMIPIFVKRAGSVVCMSLKCCDWILKVSDTFGLRIRMGRKECGLLIEKNETSRQNNFTRATKAHYEIRALPSCGTNHKTSTNQ